MRTILRKNITIEVGLIEQAAQVNIQDPSFSTEGAGGTLILAAKTTQQVEIEQVR